MAMGNRLISDDEREQVVRWLRKGETDSSKIAANVGVRKMSVAGVWAGLTKSGAIPAALRTPRVQHHKQHASRAVRLSKKRAPLRKMVLREGAILKTLRRVYVRDPNARRQCIDKYGSTCFICNFSFKKRYGKVADGLIHVHHVRQLSSIGKEHRVIPVEHLRPVCPNCHAVLHLKNPAYHIEEVRSFLRKA